jgi:hypothetical protein
MDGGGRAMSGTIALRESARFTELGCNDAVGADFKKVNSWVTVMICSEAP